MVLTSAVNDVFNNTVGDLNDTRMERVNESSDPGTVFYVYYYGMFLIIACVNIPGNILVIRTVLKTPNLRQPCNFYIVSLAVTDLLIGFVYPVYNVSHLEHVPEISRPLGQWNVCRFLVTEVLALEICSSYHLVAITVTRYIAIVYPLRYHLYVTTKSTRFVIATIWVLSQGVCIVMYTIYNPEEYINKPGSVCRYELIFSIAHVCVLFIIQLFLPLLIMLGLYVRIAKIARTQAKVIALQERVSWNNSPKSSSNVIRHELKSTFMVSILLGCFTIGWMPMMIYFFYEITCVQNCNVTPFIRASCRILLFTNSAVNVFIYAGRLAAFRKSIRNDFTKLYKILCSCAIERFGMKHSNSVSSNKSIATHTDISQVQSNLDYSTNL
ncbi:melanocortin receptor 5-like [Saccostrea echinata]|uniref:melanocortin receptor 5-like n=1 Tax=Saccostrea echinata TaxID=191078 RepID=UPI002A7F844E|nr:melanocortin receptor 5-like [Saccostrea echinata]